MAVQDTQGTYTNDHELGFAGKIAEGQTVKDVYSLTVEGASVAFGLAVGAGAADESCTLGGTGFAGFTVADKSRDADQFDVGEVAGVMRKGTIWLTATTNVSPSDPVTFTAATGVVGAGLATTIANATFETTATAGNLVRVYLA